MGPRRPVPGLVGVVEMQWILAGSLRARWEASTTLQAWGERDAAQGGPDLALAGPQNGLPGYSGPAHCSSRGEDTAPRPHPATLPQNPFGAAKPREAVIAEKLGKTEEEVLKEEVTKEKLHVRLLAGLAAAAEPAAAVQCQRHWMQGRRPAPAIATAPACTPAYAAGLPAGLPACPPACPTARLPPLPVARYTLALAPRPAPPASPHCSCA